MKKTLFLYLLLLLALNFQGQQLSQFSYFTYNYMQYNHAVVGTAPCLDLKFGVRRQWKGFEGAPITGFANIHGKIGKQTKYRYMGLGALVETDDAGPFAYTSIQLAYSYHQKLANKYYLAAGLSLGLPLQRQFRDIHAASSHIALTWDIHSSAYGQSALGIQPQAGMLL